MKWHTHKINKTDPMDRIVTVDKINTIDKIGTNSPSLLKSKKMDKMNKIVN